MKDRIQTLPLRARQAGLAREVILGAARQLFATRGYAHTSMQAVARLAGVSIQTVYSNVGGKPALVMALVDLADQITDVAVLAKRVEEATDPSEVLRRAAALRRAYMEKAADIVRTLGGAADVDEDVAQAWREGQRRSRRAVERIAQKLAGLRGLRPDLGEKDAADMLFALFTPALYTRLTVDCGWGADRYESWLSDSMGRLVLDDAARKRRR